ncbi:MAG: hypothetical protein GY780_11715 [bacterium]|nr:hypothetical protein [bacterium]
MIRAGKVFKKGKKYLPGNSNSIFWPCVLLLVVFVGGCSDHGDPVGVIEPPGGNDPVSFSTDIQPVFDMNCIGCHGAGGNAGLDLRNGLSFNNLVGVEATASTGLRVVVGDADTSVLYQRLFGAMVAPMPPSGVLPESVQSLVAQWINEGALNN